MNLHEVAMTAKMVENKINKKYEHIDTITLKEKGITAVERTKEPGGKLYNFEKIKVLINCGAGEKSSPVRIYLFRPVSSTPDAYATECVSTATTKVVLICGEIKNGFASAFTCNATIPSSAADRISVPSNELTEASVINHLNLNLTSGTFPVGTTIAIYAVRK